MLVVCLSDGAYVFLTFLCAPLRTRFMAHVMAYFLHRVVIRPKMHEDRLRDCSLNANATRTLLLLLPCRSRSNVIRYQLLVSTCSSQLATAQLLAAHRRSDDKLYTDTNNFQCSTTTGALSFRRPSHGAKKKTARHDDHTKHSSFKLF